MAANEQPAKPVLQKPPGFRDTNASGGKPIPRPPAVRKAPLPASFQPRRRQKSLTRICCCIFFLIFLLLVILVILAAGFFYIWFDPRLPAFHLQSFKISSLNVTSKLDGTYLNAATVARVEVRNPNSKLKYLYGETNVDITLGGDESTPLGSKILPGFVQNKLNTTSLKIETSMKNELIQDEVGSRLKSGFRSKELVVNVRVKTKVGVDVEGLESGMLGVDVFCGGITLKDIDGGDMPKCGIRTLKWININ
ncbi:uncharacterized protein LOC126686063 [Mercurialis annua]|uniref:uncharacterized protein LOC126686063 n=1 Tax=Mercurialis annua TaxID=3986 RepID=UPI00215EFEB0|nr:uncharacterized protein LOC126686063 [Mercurialis annua]